MLSSCTGVDFINVSMSSLGVLDKPCDSLVAMQNDFDTLYSLRNCLISEIISISIRCTCCIFCGWNKDRKGPCFSYFVHVPCAMFHVLRSYSGSLMGGEGFYQTCFNCGNFQKTNLLDKGFPVSCYPRIYSFVQIVFWGIGVEPSGTARGEIRRPLPNTF